MFLVKDRMPERYSKIRRLMKQDPALGMFAAAANFEWTMHRAISSLSKVSSKTIRKQGQNWHGLEAYSAAWKSYVSPRVASQLSRVIRHWGELRKAFELRNRLVRGGATNGIEHASRRGETIIEATDDLMQFCREHNIDLMNGTNFGGARMGEMSRKSSSCRRARKGSSCKTASCKETRCCKKEGRTASCKDACRTSKTASCKENRTCHSTSSSRPCKTTSRSSNRVARSVSSRSNSRSLSSRSASRSASPRRNSSRTSMR